MKTAANDPAKAYAQRARDIERLLGALRGALKTHAADAKADPTHWGRVGDLGQVRNDLIDMVAFVGGLGRGAVEATLAE